MTHGVKTNSALFLVAAVLGGLGVAVGLIGNGEAAPVDDKTVFCSEYVPNAQAESNYTKWTNQNPGDRDRWVTFRNAICAGSNPTPPSMLSAKGKGMVAAGKMALPDAIPPPTTTTTTTTTPPPPPPNPQCSNGVNDDGAEDSLIDYPADPGCTSATDTSESPNPAPPPPGLAINSPAQGTTVSGQVTVRATDQDSRITWVGFYPCDGDQSYEDHVAVSGVWEIVWDSTTCANGTRNMGVYAFNDAGTIIHQVPNWSLNVDNTTLPPPPPPPPSDCDPTGDPGPISGMGYTVRFKDCFSILDRTVWCDNQWWESNPVAGSQTVANGELRLRRARVDGYRDTTMTTEPCGQANPKSYQYGYFEARMKHETVHGNGPAFWLFSTAHATNPNFPNPKCPNPLCLSAELDVFEGFGTINYGGSRTDDFFSGTLHRNSSGHYGVANQSRHNQRGTGLDMSQYHVYAARWTPTTVCFYIDGILQADSDGTPSGCLASFDSFAQPMHLLLYNWTTGWEDENLPNASTQAELDMWVDWVRVWQQ